MAEESVQVVTRICEIGKFCVIHSSVEVAPGVVIENFVEIMDGCTIGADTWIRSFCRIGGDCSIGHEVVLKCAAILGPGTVVETGSFIGPQVICLSSLETMVTGTIIKERAFIGAGTKIMPGVTIGEGAVIGAMSFVDRDCEAGERYVGVPIRELGTK